MTKKMQKLKQKSNKEIVSEHKSLSIQFSLDGFSFCIRDSVTNEILVLTEYPFSQTLSSPSLLLDKITQIFESDKDLQIDFDTVKAIHENRLVTQVPNDFFDESRLKSYLSYSIKTLASDFVAYDDLTIGVKNVYVPYVNVNNFLFENFGEFEFKHHSTLLIEQLTEKYNQYENDIMFIHVTHSNADILIFRNGKFVLFNSFSFQCKEDFIYYILFCAEQLNMNPDEFSLYFAGHIINDFETYSITHEYIKNIEFLQPNHDFLEKSDFFFPHSHYTLLS